jgi:hypothetical protein
LHDFFTWTSCLSSVYKWHRSHQSARPINSLVITKMKNNLQGFGHFVHHTTQVLHQFLAIKEPLHSDLCFCQLKYEHFYNGTGCHVNQVPCHKGIIYSDGRWKQTVCDGAVRIGGQHTSSNSVPWGSSGGLKICSTGRMLRWPLVLYRYFILRYKLLRISVIRTLVC